MAQVIAEMTNGGVDRSVECTGNINAMISAFECVHDVSVLPIIVVSEFKICKSLFSNWNIVNNDGLMRQGWGVAVLVGVPNKDDAFKTHPMNLLNERTLKGTFFGNYKPRSDLPAVVEKYMKKVCMYGEWILCVDEWMNDVDVGRIYAGAGVGEVHHPPSVLLGNQQSLWSDVERGKLEVHHQNGTLIFHHNH